MLERAARTPPRAVVLTACAALLTACAGPPRSVEYVGGGKGPDTADGLYRVRSVRLGAVFLRPGADFSAYRAILIAPVSVTYANAAELPGRGRERGNAELSPAMMERFERIFRESLERELRKSQYAVVSEPGPDVLRVTGHIVDLVVDVPTYRGGEEVSFILKAGAMTLVLDVNDSESGAPLARVADRRPIAPSGAGLESVYRSSPVRTWSAVRDVFDAWARILRQGLDQLHELPPLPPPGAREGPPERSE